MVLSGCVANTAGRRTIENRAVAVADEPLAVEIGRQVLQDGGNAVDAAVAMGLSLGVTLPSRAGLSAAGACILHDPAAGAVRILDFASPALEAGPQPLGQPLALRAFRGLHAAFGSANWATVVAPAERLALLGHATSRTLAADFAAIEAVVGPDSDLHALYATPGGGLPRAGDTLVQPRLGATLAMLRGRGAAALGMPPFDRAFPAASEPMPPVWRAPIDIGFGADTLSVAPMEAVGGPAQADVLAALADSRDYANGGPAARAGALAAALLDAHAGQAGNANGETALGTVFAAMSGEDFAIACGLSMGGLFGTLTEAGETGVLRALGVPADTQVLAGLSAWRNEPKTKLLAIGAGSGFFSAATVPMAEAAIAKVPPREAAAAPRLGWEPRGGNLVFERSHGEEAQSALREAGYSLRGAESLGWAAYIVCDWDRRSPDKFCFGLNDPRGQGSASLVEELNTGVQPAF